MTVLEACNEILMCSGIARATATDTGGTSDISDAERFLDRESRRIQGERWWHCARWQEFELTIPTVYINISAGDPTFTYNETVTNGGSASARFAYRDDGYTPDRIYLTGVTGTFASGNTVAASAAPDGSGATFTAGTVTTQTTGKLAIPSSWLRVRPSRQWGEWEKFGINNNFLWRMTDAGDETFVWEHSCFVEAVELISFASIPWKLAEYIVRQAAVEFQRYYKRGQIDDAFLRETALAARVEALREDNESERSRSDQTDDGFRIRGGRDRFGNLSWTRW